MMGELTALPTPYLAGGECWLPSPRTLPSLLALQALLNRCPGMKKSKSGHPNLQELERRAVLIGFKPCQARLYACFVQKASFLFWLSDPDAVDDTDRIVHI